MLLKTKGQPQGVESPIVRKITRDPDIARGRDYALLEKSSDSQDRLVIIPNNETNSEISVTRLGTSEHLNDGDIVVIHPSGLIRTLYRTNSGQNFILVTERCNSNCLMCSQPPMDRDDVDLLHSIHKQLIPLIPKSCNSFGITGGEPTILGPRFIELLELLKEHLPKTSVHILTNGRAFSIDRLAEVVGRVDHKMISFGIPLYSDYYQTHDYVVQSKNAFYQTVLGIQNLRRYNQRIEIRVVLHSVVVPRLPKLADYIYKNFPYVEHVALMGLEMMGYTRANINKLWIDPVDYMTELESAVMILSKRGINVSIYNTPLCLLPENLWPYAKRSISDWKNIYLEECQKCEKLDECGGLFASATFKHSEHIKAFT